MRPSTICRDCQQKCTLDELARKQWLKRCQVSYLFEVPYDQAGFFPTAAVPRLPAGKSHLFYREAINPFLLKVAESGVSLRAYCEEGAAAPRARKRGRPPKRPAGDV